MDRKQLQQIPLFASLSKSELKRLEQWTDEIDVPEGTELGREGSIGHEFCVIEDGAASVRQDGDEIAVLGPGDFFGEIGLLETARRTASVVATTPMRLIVMFERDFREMEREMPTVAAQVRQAIRDRLASS